MTAMPTVKPSTTGHRDVREERPTPANAGDHHEHPGHQPDDHHCRRAEARHHGHEHDGHRAGGPDTCTFEPPNTAATSPATIAVTSPASAPSPVAMPKPRARGNATTPTVRPATRSACHVRGTSASRPGVEHAADTTPDEVECSVHEAPAARRPARSSVESLSDTTMNRFAAARSSASSGARSE